MKKMLLNFLLGVLFGSLVFGIAGVIHKSCPAETPNMDYIDADINFVVLYGIMSFSTSDMIRYLNSKVDSTTASYIASEIETSTSLPPALIVSLIYRESSFNPLAISKSDCIGLMQINPDAHPEKIEEYTRDQLFHIPINIRIGCKILEEYYEEEGNIRGALTRYLGTSNEKYIYDILEAFTDLSIIGYQDTSLSSPISLSTTSRTSSLSSLFGFSGGTAPLA